MEVYNLQTR